MGSLTSKRMLLAACVGFAWITMAVGGASAQDTTAEGSLSDAYAWSTSGVRDQLLQKAPAYFGSAQGFFVNKVAMSRATRGSPAKDAEANTLGSQFNYVFGGVPDAEATLAGGEKLYSGCEPHNCVGNKAFWSLTGPAASSKRRDSWECSAETPARTVPSLDRTRAPCDSTPTLTIFYPDRQSRKQDLSVEIINWARNKVVSDGHATKFCIQERFVR